MKRFCSFSLRYFISTRFSSRELSFVLLKYGVCSCCVLSGISYMLSLACSAIFNVVELYIYILVLHIVNQTAVFWLKYAVCSCCVLSGS